MTRSAAVAFVLTCIGLFAQTTTVTRFDVASVKIIDSRPANGDRAFIHSDMGRIEYHLIRMKSLVLRTWGVEDYQVVWPAWMSNPTGLYDVSATMPPGTTKEQLQVMLQGLLADRFKLSVHREMRDTKVFALEVSPHGLKLHASSNPPPDDWPRSSMDVSPGRSWKLSSKTDGSPDQPFGLTVSGLLSNIRSLVDRPFVDATGLSGYYDLELSIPLSPATEGAASGGRGANGTRPEQSDLFDALEKQLGLRVEAKTLPVEMLVIDHLERVPSEN